MAPNVVLYGSGLFGNNNDPSNNQAQLTAIQQSGFTTVILWTIHVYSDGSLYYNDTLIVSGGTFSTENYGYLPPLVSQLKASGSSVTKVLFCIGSGGVEDFTKIRALLQTSTGKQTLSQNFAALSQALAIDGYDFDDEDLYDADTISQLTELLCANNQMAITYCPYALESVWTSALQQVYTWDQQQSPQLGQTVQWWNLQCYSGGAGNDPVQWAKQIDAKSTGVSNPLGFIFPGYSASEQDPTSIQTTFASFAGTGINGGFIWNSSAIFASTYTPQQYAQAIINGLNTSNQERKPGATATQPRARST
jgi:hypothetical protein